MMVALAAALHGSVAGCAYEYSSEPRAETPGSGTSAVVPTAPADPGPACVPRHSAFCDCPDQSQGIRVCSAAGSYGPCICQESALGELETWQLSCSSERYWGGGDDGSSRMFPGRNCISCHREEREGPRYALAGTVYPTLHEPDDCAGVDGAVIRIEDAEGQVVELSSNSYGNFYRSRVRSEIALPYTAEVHYQGRVLVMQTPQSDLNCATCHTEGGLFGAPGRVVIP